MWKERKKPKELLSVSGAALVSTVLCSVEWLLHLWHTYTRSGRLRIKDGKMAKKPRDSRRKNELITSRHIRIDFYKGEYKV